MGRTQHLKEAQEYREAVNNAELKKPTAELFTLDGKYDTAGVAAYYPYEDVVRITIHNNGKIKIPGEAVHSLRLMFDKLDN
jgi:hypothetical protein